MALCPCAVLMFAFGLCTAAAEEKKPGDMGMVGTVESGGLVLEVMVAPTIVRSGEKVVLRATLRNIGQAPVRLFRSRLFPTLDVIWAINWAAKAAVQEVAAPPEVEGTEEMEAGKAESAEKAVETAKATGPKLVAKRKGRAPISPDGALVRVLSFLPKSLVEKIHDTGRPMSRYIREVLEEKLGE